MTDVFGNAPPRPEHDITRGRSAGTPANYLRDPTRGVEAEPAVPVPVPVPPRPLDPRPEDRPGDRDD